MDNKFTVNSSEIKSTRLKSKQEELLSTLGKIY